MAIQGIVNRLLGKTASFYGCCFGRYDLVVKFSSESPRIASWKAQELQQNLEKRIPREERAFVCSSLTLCRRMSTTKSLSTKTESANVKESLRAFVFIKPRASCTMRNLSRFVEYVNGIQGMRISWNMSAYNLLLTIEGNSFLDIFSTLIKIKRKFHESIVETSTFYALAWDASKKDFAKDKAKGSIPAITFVKIRSKVGVIFKLDPTDFSQVFSVNSRQFKRPGWLDECLFSEQKTVYELMQSLCKFRKTNREDIMHTSTILLLPVEGNR